MPRQPRALFRALIAAGLFCAPIVAAAEPVDHAAPGSVAGVVRDSLGKLIDHSLVLLTPLAGNDAIRTAVSDHEGRFAFHDLTAGAYRVTAILDGYESAIGRADTWMQSKIDLVLMPMGELGPKPSGSRWVLGAPTRDILRETDPTVPALEPDDAPPEPAIARMAESSIAIDQRAANALHGIDGVVRQSISDATPWASSQLEPRGLGSTTTLTVGTAIGSLGRWDVAGERAEETLSWDRAAEEERASNAERVRVRMQLESEDFGRIDMRAYYDHDALSIQSASADRQFAAYGGERRVYGYDADWKGRVWNDASLDVDLNYMASQAGAIASGASVDSRRADTARFDQDDGSQAETEMVRTAARMSKGFGRHSMHVGLRAGLLDSAVSRSVLITPSAAVDPTWFSEFGRPGWTVSVSAGESWSPRDEFSIDYGMDMSHTGYELGAIRRTMVPQAGVTVRPAPGMTLRGVITYAAVRRDDLALVDASAASVRSTENAHPYGYRVQISNAIGEVLDVVIESESRPFYYDPIGAGWDQPGVAPNSLGFYVADDASGTQEMSISFVGKPKRWGNWSVGASAGRVRGLVAATTPEQDYLVSVQPGSELRYHITHFGGRIARLGTFVALELASLDQSSTQTDALGAFYTDRRKTVRVAQDLAFLHPADTSWSLELSYATYRPQGTGSEADPEAMTPARSSVNRLSGAVAVRF